MSDTTLQRTRLGRSWITKISIMAIVSLAFGLWGLYDALVVYPGRGNRAAQALELQYYKAFEQEKGAITRDISVDDPKTRLATLKQNPARSSRDEALYQWLDALDTIGKLTAENTTIPRTDSFRGVEISTPAERYRDLSAIKTPDTPLAKWDIPIQWLIFAVGTGVGLYLSVLIMRVAGKSYRWNPTTQELHLPDGSRILPADIDEFDKRKWDKFLIDLKVRLGHDRLSGKIVRLDLYRYDPLESWVLEMEKTRFPQADADKAIPEDSSAPESTGEDSKEA